MLTLLNMLQLSKKNIKMTLTQIVIPSQQYSFPKLDTKHVSLVVPSLIRHAKVQLSQIAYATCRFSCSRMDKQSSGSVVANSNFRNRPEIIFETQH